MEKLAFFATSLTLLAHFTRENVIFNKFFVKNCYFLLFVDYENKKLNMKMKSITTSLCATLLCFAVAFQSCQNNPTAELSNIDPVAEPKIAEETAVPSALINPPFQDLGVAYEQFNVAANEAQALSLANGTAIEIPEHAFVYESGEPVEEDVLLEYREFHDAADLITSGIPMAVQQEDGSEEHMQTAGMFEIKGSVGDRKVKIAPGKSISVNLASRVNDGEDYDLWYLDPETKNWDNRGASQLTTTASATTARAKNKPTAPVKPIAYAKTKPVLNFEINYDAFPALKKMKGILWQHTGKDQTTAPENNQWIFKEKWNFVELKKGRQPGMYLMVLSNDDKKYEAQVSPTRKGDDLAAALEAYEQEMSSYQAQLMSHEQQAEALAKQARYSRKFSIQEMGVHNCDLIIRWPGALAFEADIDLGKDVLPAIKQQAILYLVTGDGRSVVRYSGARSLRNFIFSPLRDNCLVAVLPGNKVATFSQEDFKKHRTALGASRDKQYTFKMKMEDGKMESLADIQALIDKIS